MNYTVSVRLMTYMHAAFVREAMDSILQQRTNFMVEVVVGDDFSSDGTLDIIREYKNTENIHIKILERKIGDEYWSKRQKIGRLYNYLNILENCFGKYIALLDGDDYWTDPLKLQKQVDFMEANSDCIACHHWQRFAVEKNGHFEEIEAPKEGYGYFPQAKSGVESIFSNKMRVSTRTILFKNVVSGSFFPAWFTSVAFGDVALSFLLGRLGKFGFIDEEMAVYRVTTVGASTAGLKELGEFKFRVKHYKNYIEIWDYANELYSFKYNGEAIKTIKLFYSKIISGSVKSVLDILNFNLFRRRAPISQKLYFSLWIVVTYSKVLLRKK